MLVVESLVVKHGKKCLLGPVSFEVNAGQTLIIMGETGAGKSLIALSVMGTLPKGLIATGKVWLNGERIDDLPYSKRQQMWGRSIAMLPQEPWRALDPLMRAHRQVYETHRWVAGLSARVSTVNTHDDFNRLNLVSAAWKFPGQLSGGMSQRVAFAAAVAAGAPLMLADEPTKGLDADRRDAVIDLLHAIPQQQGGLIVITHDIAVAQRSGGQMLVLKEGNVVEAGATRTILARPAHEFTAQLIAVDPQHWDSMVQADGEVPLLTADELVVGRGNKALTESCSFTVNQDSRVAVTGPSGVGKSTLLDTLAGLIKPVSGRVIQSTSFGTTDVQKIYQDPPAAFAPHISLEKSLKDVASRHRARWQTAEHLLESLGVSSTLLQRKPDEIFGGELQRIAIVRALLVRPKLLLADEPTSRLDPITQKQTLALMAQAARENGTSVVLVTHDSAIAQNWAGSSIPLSGMQADE